MSLFSAFSISSSGMNIERQRLEVIANNIANAGTTRTQTGEPFKRKFLITQPQQTPVSPFEQSSWTGKGVKAVEIAEDDSPPNLVYEPGHPDADGNGFVQYPNFDIVNEMINLITATRTYQANLNVFSEAKNMMLSSLDIGK